MQISHPAHIVAIFGGAVSGSEAAHRLAQRGIHSVVFDQDALPYGKIEHGLPKWHIKLRDKEERQIDERMSDPKVRFVPGCKLGVDIRIEEVLQLPFSAVLLAVGAWKDRPLPIEGVDRFIGQGFHYQNAYVMAFNQHHTPDYAGPDIEYLDGSIVVGGGLASIDVIKILMLETTLKALRDRGLETDLFTLEKKGIPKILEGLGVSWEDLGLKGCTLFYRRRTIDMPLNEIAADLTPEKAEKKRLVREKLMRNYQSKYLFDFKPLHMPVGLIEEEGRLNGLVFRRTEVKEGKAVPIEGSDVRVPSPLTISSIGSLPEPLSGLPMKWGLLDIESEDTGKVSGFSNVFALGNTVTGRGNILASRIHGRLVADHLMDEFLDWREADWQRMLQEQAESAAEQADRIGDWLTQKGLRSVEEIEGIQERIRQLQLQAGFDGDYAQWAGKNAYVRLEDMLESQTRETA